MPAARESGRGLRRTFPLFNNGGGCMGPRGSGEIMTFPYAGVGARSSVVSAQTDGIAVRE